MFSASECVQTCLTSWRPLKPSWAEQSRGLCRVRSNMPTKQGMSEWPHKTANSLEHVPCNGQLEFLELVGIKLPPHDNAITTKPQERLVRQVYCTGQVWSTRGSPRDWCGMQSGHLASWAEAVTLMDAFPEPQPYLTCLSGLIRTSTADTLRFSECPVCPRQNCYPSPATKHLEFLGRFSRSLNSMWTKFLAGKGNVWREKFNIW